jgi:hypothetical protein
MRHVTISSPGNFRLGLATGYGLNIYIISFNRKFCYLCSTGNLNLVTVRKEVG